jgi:hypothetical protein
MSDEYTTDAQCCTLDQAKIIGENCNKIVKLGTRQAIIHYSGAETACGGGNPRSVHKVWLDFASDPNLAGGEASDECTKIICELFPKEVG